MKKDDGEKFNLPESRFISSMGCDDEGGDNYLCLLTLDDIGYEKHDRRQVKCNFVGEIPQSIYDLSPEQRNEKALQYVARVIKDELIALGSLDKEDKITIKPTNASKKHANKDNMKCAIFERKLSQVKYAAKETSGHYFLSVGDALRTPNYQLGHGANDALRHVRLFSEFIGKSLTIQSYNDHCEDIAQLRRRDSVFLDKNKAVNGPILVEAVNAINYIEKEQRQAKQRLQQIKEDTLTPPLLNSPNK